ncbi:MAG: hypothetical protein QXG39_00210 [Candidatus Aenigmatarchaeota archaeon]
MVSLDEILIKGFDVIKNFILKYGIVGILILGVALFLGMIVIMFIMTKIDVLLKWMAIIFLIIFIIGVCIYLWGTLLPPEVETNITNITNTTGG